MLRAVTFDFWETLVHDSAEKMRDQRLLRIGGGTSETMKYYVAKLMGF